MLRQKSGCTEGSTSVLADWRLLTDHAIFAIETVTPTLVSTATFVVASAKQTAKTNWMFIYDHS